MAFLLIIIGIGIFLIWPKSSSANGDTTTPTATAPAATTPTAKGNGVAKLLRQYAPDIKNQIAQGLHMTPDQLSSQLQSGKTLTDVATVQNVSATQLQNIVANSLQSVLQPAVQGGNLTQKQLDRLVKKYQADPALLDHLLGGKATKGTPVPSGSATPGQ